jgi:hypothetical protein
MFRKRFHIDFFKRQAQTHPKCIIFCTKYLVEFPAKRFYSQVKNKVETILPEKWKNETILQDIINGYYSSPEEKWFLDKSAKILKMERLFTMGDWKKLTKGHKLMFPDGLRILLDESMKCSYQKYSPSSYQADARTNHQIILNNFITRPSVYS